MRNKRHNTYCLGREGCEDWKTEEEAIRFCIYCPSTWFSERSFKLSSFTDSTRCERSEAGDGKNVDHFLLVVTI